MPEELRELDRQVAEALGLPIRTEADYLLVQHDGFFRPGNTWDYFWPTTDAYQWAMLLEMMPRTSYLQRLKEGWFFDLAIWTEDQTAVKAVTAEAATIGEAVCRAFLAWKGSCEA